MTQSPRREFSPSDSAELIALAQDLADAARAVTLSHFRSESLISENKEQTHFDPVTVADRDAEAAMRALIEARRPQDGIYGEEHGLKDSQSGLTWVLDPIDGTRGFISGTPTWGVLIGLRDAQHVHLGVIDQPYIGERFLGGFGQARLTGPLGERALKVRQNRTLDEAILFSTFPEVGTPDERRAFEAVARQVKLTRYGTDCYAYGLIAAGQVDLVIEAGLQPYDVMGPIGVIEAAGGIVTNWQGKPALEGGQILAAGCPKLHAQALEILQNA